MKPPRFDDHAPRSIDEAVALLARYGGDAKVLAGGQSLMPMLNFRLARPAALVDLNRIPALAYVREDDGTVAFGAMTRQRTIEFSPLVAQRVPLLREATRWVTAARAAELVEPDADVHASAESRRHLTRVLTARAVRRAIERAR